MNRVGDMHNAWWCLVVVPSETVQSCDCDKVRNIPYKGTNENHHHRYKVGGEKNDANQRILRPVNIEPPATAQKLVLGTKSDT